MPPPASLRPEFLQQEAALCERRAPKSPAGGTTVDDVGVGKSTNLTQALDWADRGMDFADALNLASAADCDAFASFDGDLRRRATSLGALAARAP